MTTQLPHARHPSGRFVKGRSGNPAGRPKGSTGHIAELRRLEEDALKLGINVADVIAETARLALDEVGLPELIPLIDTITDAAKQVVRDGEIGPSSVAVLRTWYDDHRGNDDCPSDGAFFAHVGLPKDCSWDTFREHYRVRGRIDCSRHAQDLESFPLTVQRIKELRDERLLIPVIAESSNKLKIGFD